MNRENGLLKIALLCLLTSGIGHIGMIVSWVWLSVLIRMLQGFEDGCMLLIFYFGIAKLFSTEHLGGNTGIVNPATMIGYIAGAKLYGHFGEALGYGHSLWISDVTTILLIPPLWPLHLRQKRRLIESAGPATVG
jgi:MFS family permease